MRETKTVNKRVKNIYFRVSPENIQDWTSIRYVGRILDQLFPGNEKYWSIRMSKTIILPEPMAKKVFDNRTKQTHVLPPTDSYIVVLVLYSRTDCPTLKEAPKGGWSAKTIYDKSPRHVYDIYGMDILKDDIKVDQLTLDDKAPIPHSNHIFGLADNVQNKREPIRRITNFLKREEYDWLETYTETFDGSLLEDYMIVKPVNIGANSIDAEHRALVAVEKLNIPGLEFRLGHKSDMHYILNLCYNEFKVFITKGSKDMVLIHNGNLVTKEHIHSLLKSPCVYKIARVRIDDPIVDAFKASKIKGLFRYFTSVSGVLEVYVINKLEGSKEIEYKEIEVSKIVVLGNYSNPIYRSDNWC